MSNQVANRVTGGALAAAQALKRNLSVAVQALPESGGKQFLRFLQDGNWVFGQSNEEIAKGKDELALNPMSIRIGWSCWSDHDKKSGKKNELIEERTVALGQTPILKHDLADHGWDWREMVVCDFKVLSGKHKGKQITYNPTSVGGVGMMRALMDQILVQLEEDELNIVPVVTLESDHYMHKQWGRTYTPEFEIVEFVSMDGEAMSTTEPEEAQEPEPAKPARKASEPEAPRRRAIKEEEPEAQEPEQEPEAEDEAPRRRRRR